MQTALPYSVPSCVLLNDTRDAWKLEPATASQRGHHGKRTCREGQLTGLRGHFDAREPLFYVIASITCPPAPFWRPKAYFCQRLLLQRALRRQIVARRRIPAAGAHKPLPENRRIPSPQGMSPFLKRRSLCSAAARGHEVCGRFRWRRRRSIPPARRRPLAVILEPELSAHPASPRSA